mmetsp:Transcript_33251/g.86195  ORF Transcript_33251/g.86195 Transcript_33251/m.86195 type:complete len:156 (-) Transcript_33251:425-892(-)
MTGCCQERVAALRARSAAGRCDRELVQLRRAADARCEDLDEQLAQVARARAALVECLETTGHNADQTLAVGSGTQKLNLGRLRSMVFSRASKTCPGGCAICHQQFRVGEKVKQLDCSQLHVFHGRCLGMWLRTSQTCPMCRCAVNLAQKRASSCA